MIAPEVVTVALACILGCANTGYYLVRWHDGRDIREHGSGNAGARNTGRVLGSSAFALAFAPDVAKGLIAVLVALARAPHVAPLCAIAVTAGHVFPAQHQWRGGKGIATAIGAIAILDIVVLGVITASFGVMWLVMRHVVPAGMLAFMCGAFFALMFRPPGIGCAVLVLSMLL